MSDLIKILNINEMPLVTFAVFAYNQEKFIREAVDSAFAQDYKHLEIILSDDCSTDQTFKIMQEMAAKYAGPHKIILNKNESNLNIGGHINKVMEISSGELVVVAAGDDISKSIRTSELVNAWVMDGKKSDLLCSDYMAIDQDGREIGYGKGCQIQDMNLIKMAKHSHGVIGATAAWTKRMWINFDPLPDNAVYEDQIIPFRAVLCNGLNCINKALVMYRQNVSTWVDRVATSDPHDIQKRTRVLILNSINAAAVQLNDVIKFNKYNLIPLITSRLNTYSILFIIYSKKINLIECFGLLKLARYNKMSVVKAIIKVYFPFCHKLILYKRLANSSLDAKKSI